MAAVLLWWGERRQRIALEGRFRTVVDADALAAEIVRNARAELVALTDQVAQHRSQVAALDSLIAQKSSDLDAVAKEISIFDERRELADAGFYAPHFEFQDSEQYKAQILSVRDSQKSMINDKTAVRTPLGWSVNGSTAQGRTMLNRAAKLTLRAFNGECDAAVSNVRWNNAATMEKRIITAKDRIDKLNATLEVMISSDYLAAKLRELRLTHEYREKLRQEKEDRAEQSRLAREEQRLLRDLEDAEQNERNYSDLLTKARAEAESVVGPKLEAYRAQIEVLENKLAAAQARVERAQAMAERTTSGYVYIISNVGSFGRDVVKIGLTRRLDPMDRVYELGDASVPFVFDVHAVIYSDAAPALERALHAEFHDRRINASNFRKEFFRASLDEVEDAVRRLAPSAPFFRDIEAREYRETLARRQMALVGAVPQPAMRGA
ncbi:DUF4041 domain-containing protein [Hyphomicrobium sp. 1Nfss2.1]|uniref:DUF4041 domain-containing protein n=1 Tax=Hyphomicrobium sp. 1Nfss2.1 TaxID=3413936 RepID=UPI003C7BDDDE